MDLVASVVLAPRAGAQAVDTARYERRTPVPVTPIRVELPVVSTPLP